MSIHRQVVRHQNFTVFIDNLDERVLGTTTTFNDDALVEARLSDGFVTIGDAFDNVLEAHLTAMLGDDSCVIGVPFANLVALLHLIASLEEQLGTVRDVGRHQNDIGVVVVQLQFGGTANDNLVTVVVLIDLNGTKFVDFKVAVILGFGAVGHQTLRGLTTLVEGTQGQLGARLTDGLGSDNAHSLTLLDKFSRRQVAAIAIGAHATLRLASQHGTDFDALQR